MIYEDTNLYNDMDDRNYIFSVPIIQNAYKSYRVSFLGGKVEMHSLQRGLSLGVGQ